MVIWTITSKRSDIRGKTALGSQRINPAGIHLANGQTHRGPSAGTMGSSIPAAQPTGGEGDPAVKRNHPSGPGRSFGLEPPRRPRRKSAAPTAGRRIIYPPAECVGFPGYSKLNRMTGLSAYGTKTSNPYDSRKGAGADEGSTPARRPCLPAKTPISKGPMEIASPAFMVFTCSAGKSCARRIALVLIEP
jgi:hypothetical protein